ncbi:hypothetical protein VTL71DRAFT_12607 [Oculimacula yallundae]|uniref:Uncharacterized protein n=1 Tax=Oculimacula yallundae TaxID=86028 RepID=A0ABR4CPA1_9HELO
MSVVTGAKLPPLTSLAPTLFPTTYLTANHYHYRYCYHCHILPTYCLKRSHNTTEDAKAILPLGGPYLVHQLYSLGTYGAEDSGERRDLILITQTVVVELSLPPVRSYHPPSPSPSPSPATSCTAQSRQPHPHPRPSLASCITEFTFHFLGRIFEFTVAFQGLITATFYVTQGEG